MSEEQLQEVDDIMRAAGGGTYAVQPRGKQREQVIRDAVQDKLSGALQSAGAPEPHSADAWPSKNAMFWPAMAPFGLKTGASGPKSRSGPVFQNPGPDFGPILYEPGPLGPLLLAPLVAFVYWFCCNKCVTIAVKENF